MFSKWRGQIARAPRSLVLSGVLAAILIIAIADWRIGLNLSLGAIYVVPILVAAAISSRSYIILLSIACAALRQVFGTLGSNLEMVLNFFLVLIAYIGSGLFIHELVKSRRTAVALSEAENQLRMLAESSPAAIMTLDEQGRILAANHATRALFGFESDEDERTATIDKLLPVLHDALRMADTGENFRTAAQCQGRRINGAPFHAHIWFSTYATARGRRLAAIAVDSSDEVREREERGLRQLLASNRVLTAAVLHEIRNLCASISTAFDNLTALPDTAQRRESEVLGSMIAALGSLASANLQGASRESLSAVRVQSLFDQFRIVAEPAWQEIDGTLEVRAPEELLTVVGDQHGLLQVLLNLMSNSLRAVERQEHRRFSVVAERRNGKVLLAVQDSGPGIRQPEKLFVPFQTGADRVGLGLYLSRALMRSFGGELRHVPTPDGCRFDIELVPADSRNGRTHLWMS